MLGKSIRIAALWAVSTLPASADGLIDQIVDQHILPGYRALAEESSRLAATAAERCEPQDRALRDSYIAAFDAWVRMSHLRFGPSEENDRAFALAFWPDTRGKTQKALRKLILSSDPVVDSAEEFGTVSIAARGFYALEFMLYDQEFAELGQPAYRCALIRAMATDIARLTAAIIAEWQPNYADLLRNAGSNDTYRTEAEALRQVFTSLAAGLQFASEARLGRPLGTFDRPRPRRAEARRSGRSLAHIDLSLKGTQSWQRCFRKMTRGWTPPSYGHWKLLNGSTIQFSPVSPTRRPG